MKLAREDTLKARPVKNQKILWEKNKDGNIIIYVPRKKTTLNYLFSSFFNLSGNKTIVLDELGSKVWGMCNAENTVEEMIGSFCREYKLNIKEAEISLLTYLKKLVERNLIGLIMEGKNADAR